MRLEFMRKTDLAVRALTHLAEIGGLVHGAALAEAVDSTRQFIPQVLSPLVRAGWVTSVAGPRGGYQLAVGLEQMSLLDVIELIEGPTDDGRCVLSGACSTDSKCAAHDIWIESRHDLLKRLAAKPLSTVGATSRQHRKARQ